MDSLSYKTIFENNQSVKREWFIIDAEDMVLGRVASEIAKRIMGKHKPSYTPNVDCGDKIIVINAHKVRLTGSKMNTKELIRYTGYPGGQRIATPREILSGRTPERLLELAVKGMLPKNRLGKKVFHNMFVYASNQHPHEAQQPKEIKL